MGSDSSKPDSSFCSRHRRYHRRDADCELCVYEEAVLKRNAGETPRLQMCPECRQTTLLWYQCSNRCECLNLDCKLKFLEDEFQIS